MKVGDKVKLKPDTVAYQKARLKEGVISRVISDIVNGGQLITVDFNNRGRHIYDTYRLSDLELITEPEAAPAVESETLTITKERVLQAASKCSTAKATLQVLFPEVFEVKHKIGYKYQHRGNGSEYIMASIAPYEMCLICIHGAYIGSRLNASEAVKIPDNITEEEMKLISGTWFKAIKKI